MSAPFLEPYVRYGNEYFEYAKFFREISLTIDERPDAIFEHCDKPAIKFLLGDAVSTTLERTRYLEAMAYGDPGVLMACPGPSLSGLMIRELGTDAQIKYFFDFLQQNNARTFFGLTEPAKGSDAGTMECQINSVEKHKSQYYLSGEKCLFGNGAAGKIGVVLARMNSGPLGIRAVLITPEKLNATKRWITREYLPMTGLRGAQIGYVKFNECPISSNDLLGEQLRPMQRGMMAVIKTFNRLRTGVGALAIGQAQAVLDYWYQNYNKINLMYQNSYRELCVQVDSARMMLQIAAEKVDEDPYNSYAISIAKVQATQTAERVISNLISMMNPTVMLENAWIAKCYRDCFAWEYMEGTRNMQYKTVFQNIKTKYQRSSVVQL